MTDTEAKALALVSIDPKALEHACLCAGRSVHHFDRMGDDLPLRASIVAHARAIERLESTEARHAAEMREQAERFSEAVTGFWNYCKTTDTPFPAALSPFIIAKPDPLVVEAREICARVCEGWTDIPNGRATAYRDGMHDDEADFAYVLNALRKANERPTHD